MGDGAPRRSSRPARWRGWPLVVVAALAAHLLLADTVAADGLYFLVVAGAAAASWVLVGPGPGRAPGVLIALGLTANALADVLWQVQLWQGVDVDLSVADVFYLASYVFLAAALTRMAGAAGQSAGARFDGWIDALIVFVAVLLVMGELTLADTLGDTSQPLLVRLVWALYPALGGDEFAILVEQTTGAAEARIAGERVLAALGRPIRIGRQSVSVSGSIGIAVSDADATRDSMIRDADNAMYAAKAAGRGGVVVFDPVMRAAVVEQRELERALQGALAGDQLRLVYQPVIDLSDESVVGFEALLRWHSPTLGSIAPERFVPLAEDLDLIGEIGSWVLREACAAAAAFRGGDPALDGLTMAVNVSAVQLTSPELVGQIVDALAASGLPASALVLEVTETALVRDPDAAAERLAALRSLGVRLALDDFGTGYSSLSYLRQFTVDVLKIDRSFISTIQGAELPPIVRALIDLGRTLDLEIVAEGVELEVQRDQLRAARCDLAQGYLFAAPLEHADAEALLRRSPARLR